MLKTFVIVIVSLAVAQVSSVRAGALVDPFLEQFRVGSLRSAERLEMDGRWPAALWTAPIVNEQWINAAEKFFVSEEMTSPHSLLTWRFLGPAMTTATERRAWYADCRTRVMSVFAADGDCARVVGPYAASHGSFAREYMLASTLGSGAFAAVAQGDSSGALRLVRELLQRSRSLGLAAEEIFIWRLRRMSLAGESSADLKLPWSYNAGLGPYDSKSAWVLWAACRQGAKLPLLAEGCGSDGLARHLGAVALGDLSPEELEEAGFPVGARAGLGATVCLKGDRLDAHFAKFPKPPIDGSFQKMWLDGKRRQAGYTAQCAADLAVLPGVTPDNRLDLWRRASEAFVTGGAWRAGLDAFEKGYGELFDGSGSAVQKRFAEWTGQLLAWCAARNLSEASGRVLEIIAGRHEGPAGRLLDQEVAAWRRRLADTRPMAVVGAGAVSPGAEGTVLDQARILVRGGGAGILCGGVFSAEHSLVVLRSALDLELWHLWARWGDGLAGENEVEYRRGMRPVAEARDIDAAVAAAAAVAGRRLRHEPWRDQIFEMLLEYDYRHLAGGAVDPPRSPFPALARRLDNGDEASLVDLHALLAVALAVGDGRGIMALTMVIPQGVLSLEERLLFFYPLPVSGPLLDGIAAADVETSLLLATVRNESRFEAAARSRAGALGWLQIMPFHYQDRGFLDGRMTWRNPLKSLEVGAGLMRENRRRFGSDPYRCVAAYNAGGGAVDRWDRQLSGRANGAMFLAWIGYPETRRYVEKVLIDREIYAWILRRFADSETR